MKLSPKTNEASKLRDPMNHVTVFKSCLKWMDPLFVNIRERERKVDELLFFYVFTFYAFLDFLLYTFRYVIFQLINFMTLFLCGLT